MTKFEDIARVTVRGKGLDAIGDGSEKSNAYLAWCAIHTKIKALKRPPRVSYRQDGLGGMVEGYEWEGAFKGVVEELWHDKANLEDPITKETMGVVLNKYLRLTNNAICISRGFGKTPTWWVRKEWNDNPPLSSSPFTPGVVPTYTEKKLTAREAGEDRAPAPVVVTKVTPVQFAAPVVPDPAPAAPAVEEVTVPVPAEAAPSVRSALVEQRAQYRKDGEFVCDRAECQRSFSSQAGLSLHQSKHPVMDAMIEAAVEILEAGGTLRMNDVGERIGKHATSIYSYFSTVNDLYRAAQLVIERKRKQEVKAVETAEKLQNTRATAEEAVQLIVGFSAAIGHPANLSSVTFFPLPWPSTKRRDLVLDLLKSGALTTKTVISGKGSQVAALVPGPAFDPGVARRLSVFQGTENVLSGPVDQTTELDAKRLDVLAVMELAMEEIRSLRTGEAVLAQQDEALVKANKQRDEALALAEQATNETLAKRDELATVQTELAKLKARVRAMSAALVGGLDGE